MHAWGRILLDLLYPLFCPACGRSVREAGRSLCGGCAAGVVWHGGVTCPTCGAGRRPGGSGRCVDCEGKPAAYDSAVSLGPYEGRLRELVIAFKQPPHRALAGFFGPRLCDRLRSRDGAGAGGYDAVVPVPLHWMDFVLRGYNPAEELAARIAGALGTPLRAGWLRKRFRTAPQKSLQLAERLRNPIGVFRGGRGVRGRVLLVDDVLTTGATLSACAEALKSSGAAAVEAAVVARG